MEQMSPQGDDNGQSIPLPLPLQRMTGNGESGPRPVQSDQIIDSKEFSRSSARPARDGRTLTLTPPQIAWHLPPANPANRLAPFGHLSERDGRGWREPELPERGDEDGEPLDPFDAHPGAGRKGAGGGEAGVPRLAGELDPAEPAGG